MISDGYYAAAAQGSVHSDPGAVRPRRSRRCDAAAVPRAGVPARSSRTGSVPPGAAAGQAGTPSRRPGRHRRAGGFGQPRSELRPRTRAQQQPHPAVPIPGQPAYPGQQPGGADALAQYAPGRRKPTGGRGPRAGAAAIRLMYVGFAATALDVLLAASRSSAGTTTPRHVAQNAATLDSRVRGRIGLGPPAPTRQSAHRERHGTPARWRRHRARRRPPRPRLLGLARGGHPARPRLDADRRHGAARPSTPSSR